ncbi:MAG: PqqD family protein [bacterium]
MSLNFFGKKKKEHNYLVLTPVRNREHEEREDGMVNVLIPRFKSEFAKKFFTKAVKTPNIKANLDEFGTATWLLIDGQKNVEEIGKGLIEKFGETIEPVYDRLTRFLTNLHRYNFISFIELKKGSLTRKGN